MSFRLFCVNVNTVCLIMIAFRFYSHRPAAALEWNTSIKDYVHINVNKDKRSFLLEQYWRLNFDCKTWNMHTILLVMLSIYINLQISVTLRKGAATGSSRPTMTSTGFDTQARPSTLTLGQIVTTPPVHPWAIITTCHPLLLTVLDRQLKCPQRCTLQVRQHLLQDGVNIFRPTSHASSV